MKYLKKESNLKGSEKKQVSNLPKINLIITEKLQDKIDYLCKTIAQVEWSGVLLYSIKGSIREPESMVITGEDLIPMHKGSQTYTEYTFNEGEGSDIMIDHFNEHPEALDYRTGLIHSHNTMEVFFSATDMDELESNAKAHDFYLSLIVNNWGDLCAKVGQVSQYKQLTKREYFATDEQGEAFFVNADEVILKKEIFAEFDCEITRLKQVVHEEFFVNNVKAIIKSAEAKRPLGFNYPQPWKNTGLKRVGKKPLPSIITPHYPNDYPNGYPVGYSPEEGFDNDIDDDTGKWKNPLGFKGSNKDGQLGFFELNEKEKELESELDLDSISELYDKLDADLTGAIEASCVGIFRKIKVISATTPMVLEEALEAIGNVSDSSAKSFAYRFSAQTHPYFKSVKQDKLNFKEFLGTLCIVLEEWEILYPYLFYVIEELKEYSQRLKNNK